MRPSLAHHEAAEAVDIEIASPAVSRPLPLELAFPAAGAVRWWLSTAVAALSIVAAFPVIAVGRFVTDGGSLVDLDARIAASLASGHSVFQGAYALRAHERIAGTLVVRLIALASRLGISPYLAEKALLFVAVASLGPATLYFLRRTNPRADLWALAAPCLALSWPIGRSLYGFALGLPLLLVTLGYALPRLGAMGGRGWAVTTLLLVGLVLASPELPLVAAGFLALCAIGAPGARRRTVVGLLASGLPAALLVGPRHAAYLLHGVMSGESHAAQVLHAIAFFPARLTYAQRPVAWILAGGLAVTVLGFVGVRFVGETWLGEAGVAAFRLSRRHVYPLALIAVLLGTVTLPDFAPHFFAAGLRLAGLLVLLALGWIPAPETRQGRGLAATTLALLCLVLTTINLADARANVAALGEYEAAAAAIPARATVLPLSFQPPSTMADAEAPLASAWGYLALDRDLRIPPPTKADLFDLVVDRGDADRVRPDDGFAERFAWELAPCQSPLFARICDEERDAGFRDLARYGAAYDRLLAWDPPPRFLSLARGAGLTIERRSLHAVLLHRIEAR